MTFAQTRCFPSSYAGHSEFITLVLFASEIDTCSQKLPCVVTLSYCLTAFLENKISIKLIEVLTLLRTLVATDNRFSVEFEMFMLSLPSIVFDQRSKPNTTYYFNAMCALTHRY